VTLQRVFPYDHRAAPIDPGGALYVPSASGLSRIDNPDLYDVLYVTRDPAAAVAEAFGRYDLWQAATFVHSAGLPFALATYDLADDVRILDLNDVDALKSIGVTRPTDVVTQDRSKTQAWARAIFVAGGYAGVQWWSFYNPDWPIIGLWDRTRLDIRAMPVILTPASVAVLDAAAAIVRQVRT
jgi:hypothetical protein